MRTLFVSSSFHHASFVVAVDVVAGFRLCWRWAWTSVLAARAANKLSSPATTADATMVARVWAFRPGGDPDPRHPKASKHAA